MSTNVGSIHYDLKLNTSEFDKASSGIAAKTKKIGNSMTSVGKKMSVAFTLPIAIGMGVAVKRASDLQETLNKVDVAFKKNAGEVKKWSKTTIDKIGLAGSTAMEMAALFGDMGTSMGLTTKQASKMSMSMVELAGDLASFKNISAEEASTALAGIFTGETESLKRLGIVMLDTNLAQFALAKGTKKTWKEMSQAEKVMLRYEYVMSKTKNAQGDFAKTSDGTANQIRITQERFKELTEQVGTKLLPIANKLLSFLQKIIDKFSNLSPTMQKNILIFAGIVAVIGPLLIIMGSLIKSIGLIAGAFKLATAASGLFALSIGGVAVAVAALAGYALYKLITANKKTETSISFVDLRLREMRTSTERLKKLQEQTIPLQNSVKQANDRVAQAQRNLNTAVQNYGPKSDQAKEASKRLKAAHEDLSKAQDKTKWHALKLADAQGDVARAMQRAKDAGIKFRNIMPGLNTAMDISKQKADQLAASIRGIKSKTVNIDVIERGFKSGGLDMIGNNAKGTDNWRGGLTWVGEKGPEIVDLPKGSRVIPNNKINTSIYGNISIGNEQMSDSFFARLTRNQELASKNIATRAGAIG